MIVNELRQKLNELDHIYDDTDVVIFDSEWCTCDTLYNIRPVKVGSKNYEVSDDYKGKIKTVIKIE